MWSPDLTWLQDTALSVVALAATLSLVNVMLGLFSVITGKDHFPVRFRRMLGRRPASAEDLRMHGVSVMLSGAGLVIAMLGMTAGVAGRHGGGFPAGAQFFVTVIAFLAAFACMAGAYTVGVRVRFVSTRTSTDAPGMPPV